MATTMDQDIGLGGLERTARQLGLGLQDIAQVIGVDQSTLYRWRTGASVPRAIVRTRIIQFGELFELLRRLFAGPDLAGTKTWAEAPLRSRPVPTPQCDCVCSRLAEEPAPDREPQ